MREVRQTKTKQIISEIISHSQAPLSLALVYKKTSKHLPHTAFSTVYRILQQFEKEKKVVPINWRQRGQLYEWAGHPHHHHLICENCDSVSDIDDKTLKFNERTQNTHLH